MTHIEDKGTLGKRIADKRKKLGLTEQDLADALHINRTMISRTEHGKSSISIEHVIPLCRKLQITRLSPTTCRCRISSEEGEKSSPVMSFFFQQIYLISSEKWNLLKACMANGN